jgi:hypothetical protein
MSNIKETHRTLKDIYKNSRERISLALKLYGPAQKNAPATIQNEREYETIHNLINSVVSSQKFEEVNDYRCAIQDAGTWVLGAYKRPYFEENARFQPSILYVVKRGLEILHALLHRDLRRRQLSSTESQIYFEFKALVKALPDPRAKQMSQAEIDAAIEEMNRKLG